MFLLLSWHLFLLLLLRSRFRRLWKVQLNFPLKQSLREKRRRLLTALSSFYRTKTEKFSREINFAAILSVLSFFKSSNWTLNLKNSKKTSTKSKRVSSKPFKCSEIEENNKKIFRILQIEIKFWYFEKVKNSISSNFRKKFGKSLKLNFVFGKNFWNFNNFKN